ncbi:hypothetical protein BAUCODRAFT_124085 [Baudoinia panamericana UAMH 10762]|uniref:Uncharacterized protein n=1 Tax=Baudoinia panamericana (strain UAMH 10762) TaxID=717646 RepID=M2MD63_BAUPA|nr:uncharacterized protein BAUCODRAFT_124085 [Baudoinia panamericana UAMH 10762]EMC94461.1 hypothetical protein BAUCODRAFT_124085 [Baudoinia panamericana UAMH 10762]
MAPSRAAKTLQADVRTDSRVPRVATPSFWTSLIPKAFRRSREPADTDPTSPPAPKERRRWNPATTFILLAILVGSNAINLIALRNDMANFSRKTDAKLELLREVLKRVQNGEDVDVKKELGTGDPEKEAEWEEVMREVAETDQVAESRRKLEERKLKKAEERRQRDEERKRQREREASPGLRKGRPKFMM